MTAIRKQSSLTFHPGEGFCVVGWIESIVDRVCCGLPTMSVMFTLTFATQKLAFASQVPPTLYSPRYIVSAIHILPCETYLPHESRHKIPL